MKVNNNKIGSPGSHLETGKAGKSNATGAPSKDLRSSDLNARDGAAGSAQVDVSERAQMMQRANDIARQPDTVDEAKVAHLQKLIDEGKYKVDADSIADRLVDEHLSIPD